MIDPSRLKTLFEIAMSWAITLAPQYSNLKGTELPELILVSHEFFVKNACGGRECRVFAWYPTDGQKKVYVDQNFDFEETFAFSVLVHESVHHLQFLSEKFQSKSCDLSKEMEDEAYTVQQLYLEKYGVYRPLGLARIGIPATCVP